MKANKPDEIKLVEIGGMIHKKYELIVHREPILLLDVNDGHLFKTSAYISEKK